MHYTVKPQQKYRTKHKVKLIIIITIIIIIIIIIFFEK
jgi:hypothetical protein